MYKTRISKDDWYNRGGFANSKLFRKQLRNGGWTYWTLA